MNEQLPVPNADRAMVYPSQKIVELCAEIGAIKRERNAALAEVTRLREAVQQVINENKRAAEVHRLAWHTTVEPERDHHSAIMQAELSFVGQLLAALASTKEPQS